MNRHGSILFFVLAAAMASAAAQGIYKTIGPDGKVIYTDKPPENANSKTDVIRAPAPKPQAVSAPASAAAPADNTVLRSRVTKQARRVRADGQQEQESTSAIDSVLGGGKNK